MSTVQGLTPPTPYSGTDTTKQEIFLLETYVDKLLNEIMPGGDLAGSSAFMPGDSIGSFQGGGIAGQVVQLIQQLLQQIAALEADSGSSQAPWNPLSSSGSPGTTIDYHPSSTYSNPPTNSTQGSSSATASFTPYDGPTSSLSSYSGSGHTVAAGNLTPQDIDKQYGATIQNDVDKYNKEYGTNLTKAFVEGIVYQESKGDPLATSTDGQDSKGLMQVSADIAKVLSPGGNQYDPNVSLDSGIHLLAIMDQKGPVADSTLGNFYGTTSFQGAGGDLDLLATKYQGGANQNTPNGYDSKVLGWMTDYLNGTPPPETY